MPRAPSLCGKSGCMSSAVSRGYCQVHAPAPFEGAKDRWVAKRPPGYNKLRNLVFRLHRGRCALCGAPGAIVDHIQSVAEGGAWSVENLQLLCTECSSTKTSQEAARARRRAH